MLHIVSHRTVLGSLQASGRSLRLCSCSWPFFPFSETCHQSLYVSCLSLLFHLGPTQVQLLERPSGHRLTYHLSNWGPEPQASEGCLDDPSPLLHAEECLEHWGRSLFFFNLTVPVFVALAIIILQLALKHFLSQGEG
jgi:hypothetical protein